MPVVAFSLVDLIIRPSQRSGINEVKRSGRRGAEVLCLQKQCDLAVGRPEAEASGLFNEFIYLNTSSVLVAGR